VPRSIPISVRAGAVMGQQGFQREETTSLNVFRPRLQGLPTLLENAIL
jgi:hypothetical protein